MKRFDYYAPQQSWRMPKWLGATIGVIFAGIAIGSGFLILQLMQKPGQAPVAAVGGIGVTAQPAVAAAAAPKAVSPPVALSAPVTAEPTAVAEVADSKHHHHHGKHESRHSSSSKSAKVASKASAAPAASSAERGEILAKHDSKEKRHEKDALDKLLGL